MATKSKIFISYSHDDSAGSTGRLHDSLEQQFGEEIIFQDVDNIQPGENFRNVIDKSIKDCEIFLVIIGKIWASQKDDSGQPKILNNDNYVRIEIETAFKYNKKIIPVIVDGSKMPSQDELPNSISKLIDIHASILRHSNWKSDVTNFCNQIKKIFEEIEKKKNTKSLSNNESKKAFNTIGKVVSYNFISIRRYIGYLAISFPVLLIMSAFLGGNDSAFQNSISSYYNTKARDVYVSFFVAYACLIFFYRGYDRKDNIIGNIGGFIALGIALVHYVPLMIKLEIMKTIETLFYSFFFLIQASFPLLLFRKVDVTQSISKAKFRRNRIYLACGVIVLSSITLIPIVIIFETPNLDNYNPIFTIETIAFIAFGVSWLIKGQVLLSDNKSLI